MAQTVGRKIPPAKTTKASHKSIRNKDKNKLTKEKNDYASNKEREVETNDPEADNEEEEETTKLKQLLMAALMAMVVILLSTRTTRPMMIVPMMPKRVVTAKIQYLEIDTRRGPSLQSKTPLVLFTAT